MMQKTMQSDHIIRGSCSLFVCRCCRTKYGWEHQDWCDAALLTEPTCKDCRYYSKKRDECIHPIHKREGRELRYEESECPF